MYYRKKPITIKAFDFSKTKIDHEGKNLFDGINKNGEYYINTLEGRHTVSEDDFVIIGIVGERYPIKRNIFIKCYEEVND